MPLTLQHNIVQTAKAVVFTADLKAPGLPTIDVTPWSIQINHRPYFLRLFLAGQVVATAADVKLAERKLTLTLPKAAPADWGTIVLDDSTAESEGLSGRIEAWRADHVAKQRAAAAEAARVASDIAVHGSMAAEETVRSHVEAVQQRERDKATRGVFEALGVTTKAKEAPPGKASAASAAAAAVKVAGAGTAGVELPGIAGEAAVAQDAAAASATSKVSASRAGERDGKVASAVYSADAATSLPATTFPAASVPGETSSRALGAKAEAVVPPSTQARGGKEREASVSMSKSTLPATTDAPSANPTSSRGNHDDDLDDAEAGAGAGLAARARLPPPRSAAAASAGAGAGGGGGQSTVSFTPRVLPTPLRESKIAEEQEWLARNQLARQQAAAAQRAAGGSSAADKAAKAASSAEAARLYYRGVAFAEAGDYRSACAAFEAAAAAAPEGDERGSQAAACLAVYRYVAAGAAGTGAGSSSAGASGPRSVDEAVSAWLKRAAADAALAPSSSTSAAQSSASAMRTSASDAGLRALAEAQPHAAAQSVSGSPLQGQPQLRNPAARGVCLQLASALRTCAGGGPAAATDAAASIAAAAGTAIHVCAEPPPPRGAAAAAAAAAAIVGASPSSAAGSLSPSLAALLPALLDVSLAGHEASRLKAAAAALMKHAAATDTNADAREGSDARTAAVTALSAAVEVAPSKLIALRNLAAASLGTGDAAGCVNACDRALIITPAAATALPLHHRPAAPAGIDASAVDTDSYATLLMQRADALLELAEASSAGEDDGRAAAAADQQASASARRAAALADLRAAAALRPDDEDIQADVAALEASVHAAAPIASSA